MFPFSTIVQGPDGDGKSAFAGSVAKVVKGKVKVLCLAHKELRAWAYTQHGDKVDCQLFADRWSPSIDKFSAQAQVELLKEIDRLYTDDVYDAVVLDPGTFIKDITGHSILKVEEVARPGDLGDKGSLGFYGDQAKMQMEIVDQLVGLTVAKRPKYVIVPWHMVPVKEEAIAKGGPKTHTDKKYQGIAYEGGALPAMDGSFKYYVGGLFDVKVWAGRDKKLVDKKQVPWYYILLQSERERECKVSVGEPPTVAKVDNTFDSLLKAIGLYVTPVEEK